MTRDLQWSDCSTGCSNSEVAELEAFIQNKLPEAFVEISRRCQGGSPSRSRFQYDHPDLGPVGSGISSFLFVSDARSDNIKNTILEYADTLPHGLVPFAELGNGSLLCFDYRAQSHPSVVYWVFGAAADKAVRPLAGSFEEFLSALEAE